MTAPPKDSIQIPLDSVPKSFQKRARDAKKREVLSKVYPYRKKMKRTEYEEQKRELQIELLKVQSWVKETKQRVIILFEGRDAAGKGGTINRFIEHLNPRGARVVALSKPNETELGQWYFQRYVEVLPTRGEMVFFDRSWYNRAVVEPVMGFCSQRDTVQFFHQVPAFENMLIESGTYLFKFWFLVSRAEQLRRFLARAEDRLKQWKLSPIDLRSLALWDEYTAAKETMLEKTDRPESPWVIVRSDCKKRARLNCMRYFLSKIPYPGKPTQGLLDIDPQIIGPKEQIFEKE